LNTFSLVWSLLAGSSHSHWSIFLSLLLVSPFACAEDNGVVHIDMKLSGLIRHVDDFGQTLFDVDGKGAPGKASGRGRGGL
jgi:hypothetical protein